jgi:hypothetical protein
MIFAVAATGVHVGRQPKDSRRLAPLLLPDDRCWRRRHVGESGACVARQQAPSDPVPATEASS